MKISEKVAYIKGLMAGLEMGDKKPESKVLSAIVDALDDIALTLEDVEESIADLGEELDELADELTELEDDYYDECEEEEDDEEELYMVVCPTCGEKLYVDEGILNEGSIHCPACNESLEFDLSELDEDEEDEEGK